MKKIFIVDWLLLLVAGLSAYSGVKLHIAGHFFTHEVWHNWAIFHIITSVLFLIIGIIHIKNHWGWYKSITKRKFNNKKGNTLFLSIVFGLVSLTGIVLILFVNGANSYIGIWHYRLGLVIAILSIVHIIKRWHLLRKSINSI